jgi:hypothetical protein
MLICRDLPGPRRLGVRVKSLRDLATNLIGCYFRLRILPRTSRILTCEFGIHAADGVELPVTTDMVVVRVRLQNDDGQARQLCGYSPDVTDSHASVEVRPACRRQSGS